MKPQTPSEQKPVQQSRKPYSKPLVERVNLVLEDAVLSSGCKTISTSNPQAVTCVGNAFECVDAGS